MAIDDETWEELIAQATAASANAHAPYSGFDVGAALLTSSGNIVLGCNVENATFGATVCAERNAIANAVVQGHRDFEALAVITPADHPVAPCGICRQVLAEFCDDLEILMVTTSDDRLYVTLDELLPHRFTSEDF
jgi:cytidine deaminase